MWFIIGTWKVGRDIINVRPGPLPSSRCSSWVRELEHLILQICQPPPPPPPPPQMSFVIVVLATRSSSILAMTVLNPWSLEQKYDKTNTSVINVYTTQKKERKEKRRKKERKKLHRTSACGSCLQEYSPLTSNYENGGRIQSVWFFSGGKTWSISTLTRRSNARAISSMEWNEYAGKMWIKMKNMWWHFPKEWWLKTTTEQLNSKLDIHV